MKVADEDPRAGIRPAPYWCRNKTPFERSDLPAQENFSLYVALKVYFDAFINKV